MENPACDFATKLINKMCENLYRMGYKANYLMKSGHKLIPFGLSSQSSVALRSNNPLREPEEVVFDGSFSFVVRRIAYHTSYRLHVTPSYMWELPF